MLIKDKNEKKNLIRLRGSDWTSRYSWYQSTRFTRSTSLRMSGPVTPQICILWIPALWFFIDFLDLLAYGVEECLRLQLQHRRGWCWKRHVEPRSDSLLICGSRHRLFIGRFSVVRFQDRRLVGARSCVRSRGVVSFSSLTPWSMVLGVVH